MRTSAVGDALETPGVREFRFEPHGRAALTSIREVIDSAPEVGSADVVVTLISQADIAMSTSTTRATKAWVAWVRGKPWPAAGEQSLARRVFLQWAETRALRSADEVWATTPVLASEFSSAAAAEIVPAGIAAMPRTEWGHSRGPLVWAGRVDIDKRPEFFVEIVERTGHPGWVYGEGPLAEELKRRPVEGLQWRGWARAETLWSGASVFVGTSAREAFGRSAVEAAAAGLPVVIGADYGAAPLLFTSPELRALCVIDSHNAVEWASAVRRLLDDEALRMAVSDHVRMNAESLTIDASVATAAARAHSMMGRRMSVG
jgi:glycosyltransferase involved in cell wall biosynthesis